MDRRSFLSGLLSILPLPLLFKGNKGEIKKIHPDVKLWLDKPYPNRKFRWTFIGKDAAGNVVFPESFVKLEKRPSFNEQDEIRFTQFFTFYEEKGQALKEYKVYEHFLNTTSGKLVLYDGCGTILEEWNLQLTSIHQETSFNDAGEEIIANWTLKYNLVDYKSTDWKLI